VYVYLSLLRAHADYQRRLDVDQDLRDQRDLFARQSRVDPLTDLSNRRHFAEALAARRASRAPTARGCRCCCSTSTTSRPSTTATGTRSAMA
jgi:GGDEF domain-containing protein